MAETLEAAARRLSGGARANGFTPQALHKYTDQVGQVQHAVIRLKNLATGEKWIRPIYLDGAGFVLGEPTYPNRKPLYCLEALANSGGETVFVCEGELCVDELVKMGIVSTTSGGANSAAGADWAPLRSRTVTIWPDNDPAGRQYAEEVAKVLMSLSCRVRIVDVAALALPSRGDAVDWCVLNPLATAADVSALPTIDASDYLGVNTSYRTSVPALDAEWPVPRLIEAPLLSVLPFDPSLLPDALRRWVMDEAHRMPCPADFIAAAAIVVLGAIVGARCAIKPKARDSWLIVPNLWGGIVGAPSVKKSPAVAVAFRPLERLIAYARETYEAERHAFEAAEMVFKVKGDAIGAQVKAAAKKNGDVNSLAQDFQRHRHDAPQPPVLRRYKSNDSTVEKLGELLRDNHRGMLVFRDELVGLLASWEREGREGDRTFYLEAWNGTASFDTDRIGRGSIFIPNLCLSVFGGIQPDKLTGFLEQAAGALANDGMLQRFQVLVYPDPVPWHWRDQEPDKDARQRVMDVFEKLAEFTPTEWGAHPADENSKISYFRFDEEAQELFIEWSCRLNREILPREDQPLVQQHLAKFEKLLPALALLFHLVDCAASGQRGPVRKDSVLRAAGWCEYLETHARRCYGLLADDGLRAAKALADKLQQGKLKDGFTARDVRRNQWRYLTTTDAVDAALNWLEDDGWLRAARDTQDMGVGRSTVRYLINPDITKERLVAEPVAR
jgi:hypothetical protein